MQLRWLPNAISTVRIVLVPFVIAAILQERFMQAFVLFFAAGFSDGLDGFLARRFHWQTRLGSLLDPIADKLLVASVFITLSFIGLSPVWLAVLVIFRDVVIIGGATVYNFLISRVNGSASLISKANTGVQGLYVLAVLSSAAIDFPGQRAVSALLVLMVVTIVTSGAHYVYTWARRAAEEGGR